MEVHETSRASGAEGAHFKMIDVGEKPVTYRRAVAAGEIRVGETVYRQIVEKKVPKGDVLAPLLLWILD